MSPFVPTADLSLLSSGDLATTSDLVAKRRAKTTVARAEEMAAAVAMDTDRLADALLREARAALAVADNDLMLNVVLAAIELDSAAPNAPQLMDEIRGLSYTAAA
ncbi:hypothetical protein [Streptomyces sp. NRRL S-15]|uniref:hypothetical protein n=1 Tax=Streptomyces sp. NRRL S-15 TaxID=1463886 RepID=UPI0004C7292B|nr:hypothetical protein [Streptomyces sp. NRRL S-15]